MRYLIHAFAFLLVFIAAGCSGGKKPTHSQKKESPKDSSRKQIATTQNIDIYGINTLQYVVKKENDALETSDSVTVQGTTYYVLEGIRTKSGQKLTLKLTTLSDMPASSMSHNWLLLKQKADASTFVKSSLQAKRNDYVAPKKMNLVIVETGLVAPGKTVAITFTTPEKTGEYEYLCTFPGHFTAGMKGILHVK